MILSRSRVVFFGKVFHELPLVAHRVEPGIDREGRYQRVTGPPREIVGSAREA
jgi:hypothetical protein